MATDSLARLTRKHGVKVGAGSPCSVEEVALAVGEVIGHNSIKSAARMNKAVVLFLEKVEHVNTLVERGITVNGLFEQVLPLSQPATKITLSNVPPFVSDGFLINELSRHGKVVSPMKKVLSGCKSPLLRHVVSHRRYVFMILNNKTEEFDFRFTVRVEGYDYQLFATSSVLKCFGCGEEGHLIRACPRRDDPAEVGAHTSADPRPAGSGGGAAPRHRRRWETRPCGAPAVISTKGGGGERSGEPASGGARCAR